MDKLDKQTKQAKNEADEDRKLAVDANRGINHP